MSPCSEGGINISLVSLKVSVVAPLVQYLMGSSLQEHAYELTRHPVVVSYD